MLPYSLIHILTFHYPFLNIHHWNTSVTFIGSKNKRTDNLKPGDVYVIVHGQTNLMIEVIAKLVLKGFKEENIKKARLDMAGNIGDYVAMVWPPGRPQEIIVSQIGESKTTQSNPSAPGVWQDVQQKELYRIPLE
jgi:hypothetical protein